MTVKQILLPTLLLIFPLISFAIDDYIVTSDLNVRSGAGKEYTISFNLEKGEKVEVLSKNGNWYKIKYLEKIGYVNSKYLRQISDTRVAPNQTSDNSNASSGILIILLAIGFLWLLPILVIISSGKTTFSEKIAWILAVLFISWFAWIFYMLLAPIKKKNS